MAKIDEVLIAIAEIKKDTSEIFRRLDKINGSIADYPVQRRRIDELEEDCEKMSKSITNTQRVSKTAGSGVVMFTGPLLGCIQ